jgi:hypothetical protein
VRRSRSLAATEVLIAVFSPLWVSRYAGRAGLGIGQTTDSGRAAGPVTVGVDR